MTAIVPVQEEEGKNYLVMATRRGIIKKTKLEEYQNIRKTGLAAITLREGDELIEVKQAGDEDDIFLVTKDGAVYPICPQKCEGDRKSFHRCHRNQLGRCR